jgi:hypothetical protein
MDSRSIRNLLAVSLLLVIPLSGCVAVGITALGVGMATGVSHTLSGIVYKTFSVPQAQLKKATLTALSKMQIKVLTSTRSGETELISASAGDRSVEVELESLTGNTTRMSVTVKKSGGILRDSATATEIILQTERYVGQN